MLSTLAVFTAILLGFVWFKRPSWILRLFVWWSLRRAGLKTRYISTVNGRYCYAERGRQRSGHASLVFVHGFSADKNEWSFVVERLPSDYHVVVVDLPGHGGSSVPDPADNISLDLMVEGLRQVLVSAKLFCVHLIGCSMGGLVIGMYTERYPDDVALMTLVCPPVTTPRLSKVMQEYERGIVRLLATTEEGIRQMLALCVYHQDNVPHHRLVLRGLLQLRTEKADFYQRLFRAIKTQSCKDQVMTSLASVSRPTQVIWGANDEMVDMSGAEMLQKLIPGCKRVDILDQCGHSVALDQPRKAADVLVDFRQSYAAR